MHIVLSNGLNKLCIDMAINMESPMNSSGIFFSTYHDVSIHMAITLLPDTVADLDAIQVAQLLQTAYLQITMLAGVEELRLTVMYFSQTVVL